MPLLLLATLAKPSPCNGRGSVIAVDTEKHLMWLCLNGEATRELGIAIGGAGAGKRKEGDGKVPLGEYPLGEPQASSSYTMFIPIGYPTETQRHAGYTGGAIGVHGPPSGLENAGALATSVDWTLGCIAVGTAAEIRDVAKWVRKHGVRRISIE